MKFRYRKKGKYVDGRIKIVIDKIHNNGLITSMVLPKPEELWDTLKCPVLPSKEVDTKNHALREPKVNEKVGKLKWRELKKKETRR